MKIDKGTGLRAIIGLLVIATVVFLLYKLVGNTGPSSDDIKAAYANEIVQMQQLSASFGVPMLAMKVNNVTKHKCSVMNNKGHYRCQIALDATVPITGQAVTNTTIVLIKKSTGWVIDRSAEAE